MSFLKDIMGGAGGGAGGLIGGPLSGIGMLGGLGGGGAEPARPLAQRIGEGMNQIAAAGGAQPGYTAPAAPAPQQGDPNNHLQLLDPNVLQSLIARFRPSQGAQ